MLLPGVAAAVAGLVFSPALLLAGLTGDPVLALSPLVSQFAAAGIFGAAFDAVFLLIAGRYVERALGPWGLIAVFVAGAYGGALARLLLTPDSMMPGFGASGGLFAIVGAYLMLYGIPSALPIRLGGGRVAQIAALACIWIGFQLIFMLVAGAVDWSIVLIEPLGGLIAGVALARPLLAWRYRRA